MSETTHIAVEDVTFGYAGTPVVSEISFRIDPGEYVGLIGPNGSGKSTLLGLILGLYEPDRGSVRLFGHPAGAFRERERVGYVAQDAAETATRMPVTVAEVVLMGRFPHAGFSRIRGDDRERAREALRRVGIGDLADRPIAALSGGQRQRAFIARALAGDADLLVLDEPAVGVDAESVADFYDLLDELNADGLTVLLVEHDVGTVRRRADRLLCLDRTLRFDGPPDAAGDVLGDLYGTAVAGEGR